MSGFRPWTWRYCTACKDTTEQVRTGVESWRCRRCGETLNKTTPLQNDPNESQCELKDAT